MPERDGWDGPADEGWGGTADEAWGAAASPTPAYGSPPPPPAYGSPPPPPPPTRPGAGKGWIYGGAGAVVVVIVVVLVIVLSSGGGGTAKPGPSASASASTSASASASASPTPSSSPTPSTTAGSGLAAIAPFPGCTSAPPASFNTSKVVEQIVCSGSPVQSKVSALGVSYAKFPTTADLDSWYQDTILKANSIVQNQGACATGATVNTTHGVSYCEGPFTDDTGTSARQLVVLAPANVDLSNGPNSTGADCPGSSYTLLIFTSPSDNVGVVALACSASPTTARAFETALNAGDFDLDD